MRALIIFSLTLLSVVYGSIIAEQHTGIQSYRVCPDGVLAINPSNISGKRQTSLW